MPGAGFTARGAGIGDTRGRCRVERKGLGREEGVGRKGLGVEEGVGRKV